MGNINPRYYYGKQIIWNAYRDLLDKEVRNYKAREAAMLELGMRLMEDKGRIVSADDIRCVFNSLPEKQRELLHLRFVDQMPVSEIAAMQGVSVSAVSHRITKCRKAFCKAWEEAVQDGRV